MLRSGKELKVFTVKSGDLKKFTQEAKKYGVLYCVLADRGNKDPNAEVDVIARAEDASKISRIVERFNLASVDTASIVNEAEKSKGEKGKTKNAKAAGEKDAGAKDGQPEPDIGVQEKAEKDRLMDALMGKPIKKEENAPNPSLAKTEKSPLSEPTLKQQRKSAEGATMTKAEKLGITAGEIMSIGNEKNDIPMLEQTGFPVAMANSAEELKPHAKFITKSNLQSGVGYAIERLIENHLENF